MTVPPRVLMCSPDYYGIEYEINPWMSRQRPCDHELAALQWRDLRRRIESLGAEVCCVPPQPGLPDLVFTANAAMIYADEAVLSRFRYPQRGGEERHFAAWLAAAGFRVRRLQSAAFFEGAGDALFCGDTLWAGYRIRSDVAAIHELGALFGCRAIPLELVNPRYYHLDTCFCPLTPDAALYYPPAFDEYGRRALEESIPQLIAVTDAEAREFACNAVVLGNAVVTNAGCPETHRALRRCGFVPYETPLGEFVKAGGSAKCLTLRLDGEDAAGWKRLSNRRKAVGSSSMRSNAE
jgi:N-dimethylarginine dimethylaminohydrolase